MRRRLPWLLCGLALACIAASAVVWILDEAGAGIRIDYSYLNDALVGLTFPVVGALIARRQPKNAVGWLFCGAGLGTALTALCTVYGAYALRARPDLPGGIAAAWLDSMLWLPSLSLIVFLLLLFPDGRVPARRWRRMPAVAATGVGLVSVALAFHPHELEPARNLHVENPLGVDGLEGPLGAIAALGAVLILVALFASLAALVGRFRRSRGRERLQLKWFTWAAGLLAACTVATVKVSDGGLVFGLIQAVIMGPLLAGAVGIAMLRHSLYEIDVVIRRTLVYAALTATLAAIYLGSVLLLQRVLDPVTSGSSLAVAVSTLAVAALFRPARARIQAAVDKRFYRRKYDAAHTLEAFSTRLREQVDLDALGGELRAVVADTMQPEHVSLWLRRPGR